MKILFILSFVLWSGHLAQAKSLYLSGVVPLTGEVHVMQNKQGQLVVNKKGFNNLKLKNVQQRQIAAAEPPISWVVLEAP